MLIRFVLVFMFFTNVATGAVEPLTDAEALWLQQHRDSLRVGIAEVPPQQAYLNAQGQLEGLAIEYLDAVENALGIKFERVLLGSYGEMMRQARTRKIDLVYAASRTPGREQFLSFTSPYNYVSNNIFVRKGDEKNNNLTYFSDKSFAVTSGTAVAEYVGKNYPSIKLAPTHSSREAFNLLAAGQVDGVGATAASAYKHVFEAGLPNITLVGPLGYDYAISLGARSDWPILTQILQKGLDSLPPAQVEAIEQRWNRPADKARVDLERIKGSLTWLLTAIALVIAAGLFWWNRSLKREIRQRYEAESQLSFLAYHDATTGLLNRPGFLQALDKAHKTQQPYALVLLGLDQFRIKNELWGQHIGNELLRHLAQRLAAFLPAHMTVARLGGDEFAVLFPMADLPQDRMLNQLVREIRRPMVLADRSVQVVSATCGVVVVEQPLERAELALQQVEVALKHAKGNQRGGFLRYDASMGQNDIQDQLWKEQLALAIEHDQLFLEYQPQLDLHKHKVVGFEALVRWQHPERGRVAPCDFIPLAERTGLISALGDWVLKTACYQAARWRNQGLDFEYVAVNVSVRQFADADFARKVMAVLAETNLPASVLELEITETLFMGEDADVRSTLDELSAQGIRFSIDDFGTGFSSLLYLKQLPVETLKLAQEFVLDLADNSSSLQIVNAATRLGHSLGMRVIAEGVEGEEVEHILQGLDCDMVQGFLYSRPVHPSQVSAEWLQELGWRCEAMAQQAEYVASTE